MNCFLKYIRKHLQDLTKDNKYLPYIIVNLNKTLILFKFLSRYTYNTVGAYTVARKSIKSRQGKYQATLILYIFANSSKYLKPKLIFYRNQSNNIREKEQYKYLPNVIVEFNKKAYNNK